jgi:hypothetical protein
LVTPVPLSPLLLLCCAYGGGSIKISLQAMPYTYIFYIIHYTLNCTVLFWVYLGVHAAPSQRHSSKIIETMSLFVLFLHAFFRIRSLMSANT